MEIFGTHLSLTLGAWRIRFSFAVEDIDVAQQQALAAVGSPRLLPTNGQSRSSPTSR